MRFVAHLKDVNSHNVYIKKSHESEQLDWCDQWLRDGDVFINCGATHRILLSLDD